MATPRVKHDPPMTQSLVHNLLFSDAAFSLVNECQRLNEIEAKTRVRYFDLGAGRMLSKIQVGEI